MKKFRKIAFVIIGIIFGGLFGLWYNGSYLDHRILVNGQDTIELSESEMMSAILDNPSSLVQETFVSFFGLGGFWIEGSWPMWFSLIAFITIFGWIGYRLNKYINNKSHEESTSDSKSNF